MAAFAVGAPQGCAETPPRGAKKCAPCAASCAETPLGRPFGAPPKGSKKGQRKIPTLPCNFLEFFAIFRGAGQVARTPPPPGLKNAPLCRAAAQCRATLLQWLQAACNSDGGSMSLSNPHIHVHFGFCEIRRTIGMRTPLCSGHQGLPLHAWGPWGILLSCTQPLQ